MMSTNELPTPQLASDNYREIIGRNIVKILDATSCSQNDLAKKLQEFGLNVNQGNVSKYINKKIKIQLSVIIAICEIFNVSIYDLSSENFEFHNSSITTDPSAIEKVNPNDSNLVIPKLGRKFITNPEDEDFEGYLQKYHCYFFPTLSKEKELLTGKLELYPGTTCCEATFSLKTNRKKHGKPIYKYYTGCAIISKAVEACYILLSSPKEGEICLINIRHFSIRHQELECRMAEVITNGAGERHFPTIHRMLLSCEPIKNEHLLYLSPHLHLNSSDIRIKKEYLENLGTVSKEYQDLIEHLTHKISPVEIYDFKEDYVISNAKQFLSKEDTRLFLSTLRECSYKVRYNKVSNKLDETVRELLLSLGYYADKESNAKHEE